MLFFSVDVVAAAVVGERVCGLHPLASLSAASIASSSGGFKRFCSILIVLFNSIQLLYFFCTSSDNVEQVYLLDQLRTEFGGKNDFTTALNYVQQKVPDHYLQFRREN